MRKIILVAAMVLASASAQAGPRSLSLAAAEDQAPAPHVTTTASVAPQLSESAPVTDAPTYVDRPPAVSVPAPAAATPTTTNSATATTTTKSTAQADKPRHKRYWTEGRIIGELHRHGIYW
jgi:hypothetical protein